MSNEAKKLAQALDAIGAVLRIENNEAYQAAALLRRQAEQIKELTGENAVLLGLLTDCASVIRTIEPGCSDESEKLADLLGAIDRAQSPSRHEGALL